MILRLDFSIGIKEAREWFDELSAVLADELVAAQCPRLAALRVRISAPLNYLEGEKIPAPVRSENAPQVSNED